MPPSLSHVHASSTNARLSGFFSRSMIRQCSYHERLKVGADGRDRTDDLRFTKPLLYQLSYIGLKTLQRIMRTVRTAVNLFSLHCRHWQARQNAFVSVTPPTASTAKARVEFERLSAARARERCSWRMRAARAASTRA